MPQNIQAGIQQLMQKDMDRKDFIKHVGIGFVALTGLAAAAKTLGQLNSSSKASTLGYGASAYGGVATTTKHSQQAKK